ncbi:hypothetical protein OIU76_005754 [Salix suchowensis]|nr:hypothetical protein OIU76_005754 [Salix suchowensis]
MLQYSSISNWTLQSSNITPRRASETRYFSQELDALKDCNAITFGSALEFIFDAFFFSERESTSHLGPGAGGQVLRMGILCSSPVGVLQSHAVSGILCSSPVGVLHSNAVSASSSLLTGLVFTFRVSLCRLGIIM